MSRSRCSTAAIIWRWLQREAKCRRPRTALLGWRYAAIALLAWRAGNGSASRALDQRAQRLSQMQAVGLLLCIAFFNPSAPRLLSACFTGCAAAPNAMPIGAKDPPAMNANFRNSPRRRVGRGRQGAPPASAGNALCWCPSPRRGDTHQHNTGTHQHNTSTRLIRPPTNARCGRGCL
jgi:hypothetical protein